MPKHLLVFAMLFLLFGGVMTGAQSDLRPVTLFLTYIPNIQFAPVYVAIEKGYFADAGLEVTLEHGDEPDGVNLIAANERPFGMIGGEQVIAARANGRPVVSVYEWFQKYPVGIVYPEGGLTSPADLAGKRVGIPGPFGASYTGLIALLTANGLTESDIQLESIGFNAPDVFCVGAVEASVVYVNNEPLQIAERAARGECNGVTSVSVFNVADDVNLVSNGMVTNEQILAEDPELVHAFVGAFDRGLRDSVDNPAEAALISTRYVDGLVFSDELTAQLETIAEERGSRITIQVYDPAGALVERTAYRADLIEILRSQFTSDDLLQIDVLMTTIELWEAEYLGLADEDSWANTQETLIDMGVIDAPIDVSLAFTNDFVVGP